MTRMPVRIYNSIEQLKAEIAERHARIKAIQEECPHPEHALKAKHGANTGNYDPTVDCYWTDYHCTICDKRWTVYKKD